MTEIYKLFAWQQNGTWRGHQMLTIPQIRAQLTTLAWRYPVFASIQSYDEHDNCLSCPIYLDLDGTDDQTTIDDARHYVGASEFLVGVPPRIYFSGAKGFHFIYDWPIVDPNCHLLAKEFVEEVGMRVFDMRVYRTFSLLRIPGSLGSTGTHYKIELTRHELMTLSMPQIRQLATRQRFLSPDLYDNSKLDTILLDDWLAAARRRLPKYDSPAKIAAAAESVELEFTPCLEHLLTTGVPKGNRNNAAFILVKFLRNAGLAELDCEKAILAYDPWRAFENDERGVSRVVKSVYRNRRPSQLGCKGDGLDAGIMRSYCSDTCFFRDDFNRFTIEDRKSSYDRFTP